MNHDPILFRFRQPSAFSFLLCCAFLALAAFSAHGQDPADASKLIRGMIQNFMAITIDGKKLTAVTYQIDQGKRAKIEVVDRFGIVKTQ